MLVDHGVEAALGEDVDEHRDGQGVVEDRGLDVDVRLAGDRVGSDDRQELVLDQLDDLPEGVGVTLGVVVEAADEVLAGVLDDLRGQRDRRDEVIRLFGQLERALILELLDDAGLDFRQRTLRVDEVVVEDVAQRLQRLVGALLEDAVTVAGGVGGEVGLTDLGERAPFAGGLLVLGEGFLAALQLTADGLVLVDEEDEDVEMRLREARAVRGAAEFGAQVVELGEEVLEALHLHHRTREAVDDRAALILRREQLAEEDLHDLAVADEHAGVDALLGLGAREQVADDDGVGGVVAILEDERGVGALAGAGGAVEPEDLAGESELLAAELALQTGPDRVEDDLAILDLEVADTARGGSGLSVAHEVKGLGVNPRT